MLHARQTKSTDRHHKMTTIIFCDRCGHACEQQKCATACHNDGNPYALRVTVREKESKKGRGSRAKPAGPSKKPVLLPCPWPRLLSACLQCLALTQLADHAWCQMLLRAGHAPRAVPTHKFLTHRRIWVHLDMCIRTVLGCTYTLQQHQVGMCET